MQKRRNVPIGASDEKEEKPQVSLTMEFCTCNRGQNPLIKC